MRVVVTRIGQDGTMQRRVVDTAQRDDGHLGEALIACALASVLPCHPIPGTAIYHICVDSHTIQVGEYDLDGMLRDLVTVVLATGGAVAELALLASRVRARGLFEWHRRHPPTVASCG